MLAIQHPVDNLRQNIVSHFRSFYTHAQLQRHSLILLSYMITSFS